jgi:hypothetical protein
MGRVQALQELHLIQIPTPGRPVFSFSVMKLIIWHFLLALFCTAEYPCEDIHDSFQAWTVLKILHVDSQATFARHKFHPVTHRCPSPYSAKKCRTVTE